MRLFHVLERIITLLVLSALIGCASGYKQFYKGIPEWTPQAIKEYRATPPPQTPIVEYASVDDPNVTPEAYLRRGYAVIGQSMFNSGRAESEEAAIQQAREVGADLVLIFNPKYTGSVTSSVPITTPNTTTSYSSGSATAYGPGGPVTAYGSGTTTTYGSTTTYVPMTVHRSDYGAVYFIKRKFSLGASVRDLNDDERRQIQTNKGVAVTVVVDDSPAFDADILAGDIIASIDGIAIANTAGFSETLSTKAGKEILISLLRNGQKIEKTVQLSP